MKHEIGGKTLAGRQRREWRQGMQSDVYDRKCIILKMGRYHSGRVQVRWLDDIPANWLMAYSLPKVGKGKTQWVDIYSVSPDII